MSAQWIKIFDHVDDGSGVFAVYSLTLTVNEGVTTSLRLQDWGKRGWFVEILGPGVEPSACRSWPTNDSLEEAQAKALAFFIKWVTTTIDRLTSAHSVAADVEKTR
jgi:hypothetical protein